MSFKKWQNVPLKIIPKEDRVKARELAICQGGCNKLSKIHNTTYQLCSTCGNKWRYHGYSCDVPNCESVADGTIDLIQKKTKCLCKIVIWLGKTWIFVFGSVLLNPDTRIYCDLKLLSKHYKME
jgi:hypothetical protein